MAQQKYNKAYEAYQQAVYRDGRNPTFWCSIGVLYYQINQYRDALDAYSRAIRLNPYISEVWYDLGTLYESCNNQVSDALDAYSRAAELDPGNPHIKSRLDLLRSAQAGGLRHNAAPHPQDVNLNAYQNAPAGPPSQWGNQQPPQRPATTSQVFPRPPDLSQLTRPPQSPESGKVIGPSNGRTGNHPLQVKRGSSPTNPNHGPGSSVGTTLQYQTASHPPLQHLGLQSVGHQPQIQQQMQPQQLQQQQQQHQQQPPHLQQKFQQQSPQHHPNTPSAGGALAPILGRTSPAATTGQTGPISSSPAPSALLPPNASDSGVSGPYVGPGHNSIARQSSPSKDFAESNTLKRPRRDWEEDNSYNSSGTPNIKKQVKEPSLGEPVTPTEQKICIEQSKHIREPSVAATSEQGTTERGASVPLDRLKEDHSATGASQNQSADETREQEPDDANVEPVARKVDLDENYDDDSEGEIADGK